MNQNYRFMELSQLGCPLHWSAHGVVGGTASALSGGKFANGAQTAAYGYLFNETISRASHAQQQGEQRRQRLLAGVKDGHLTLEDANFWYRNGNGEPLHVDLGNIDLSGISASDFPNGIGSKEYFNLQTRGSNDGLVYGSIQLILNPNGTATSLSDTYDFDIQSSGNPIRNLLIHIGRVDAGEGQPYKIYFYGKGKLGQ